MLFALVFFSRKNVKRTKFSPEFALDAYEWLTTQHHPFSPDMQEALSLIFLYEQIPFTN